MKKCIALLSALAMIGSSCAFTVTADQTLAGDVNDDGAVTSRDIVMLSQYLLGTAHYDITIPDVNNDGDANVLDLVALKNILLNGSADDADEDTQVPVDKIETGSLSYNVWPATDIPNISKTAIYVDSYEKLIDMEKMLEENLVKNQAFDVKLIEKYNKEFFDDYSIAFFFSSPLHYCADIESITAKDGKLTIVGSGFEKSVPIPMISYTALEFTKEVADTYKIKSAEYIPTEMIDVSSSDLLIYESDLVTNEFRRSYKWINSSKELDDFLADYSSDAAKDITLKYNSEFFKTNRLLVCNDMIDCPELSVTYDEKTTYVNILSDVQETETLLFIGMPSKAGENEKTTINVHYRSYPDKPVIYLYPEEETEVSVSVDLNGRFRFVYPEFTDKEKNMWKVTASPDGLLRTEDGSEYNYLFWDGIQDVDWDMSEGFVVKGSDTLSFLRNQLPKMGLTPKEYNDFIVYWLPQMQNNEYNYITFQTDKYTDNAILNVTPDPESVLRVFMAYTPVNEEEAQILSNTVKEPEFDSFERNGFTVVEWGGCKINR